MDAYSFFELFLAIFTYHAVTNFEGSMRVLVPIICLVTVFLFERLRVRLKKDWKTRKIFFPTNYHPIDFIKNR